MKEQRILYRNTVDKKLILRQRIFFAIVAVLLVIDFINILHAKVGVTLSISGFILASIVGIALSRMLKIVWHEEKEKVVSQLDRLGIIFLAIYIALEVSRTKIFAHWLSGATLNAFGLIILSGLLLGRYVGTNLRIHDVLSKNTGNK